MSINYKPAGSLIAQSIWDQVSEVGASSPGDSWNLSSGLTSSVSLLVPWGSRYALMDDMILRYLEYPYIPNCRMYPSSATITPFTGESTKDAPHGQQYAQAQLDITFSPLEIDATSGPGNENVFTEAISPHVEYLIQDATAFQWGSGTGGTALLPNEAPGRALRGFTYTQTRYFLAAIPNEILTKNDTCNSAIVDASLLGLSFPIETLKFSDPESTRTLTATGEGKWTLRSSYTYRPQGWNKFWRAETQSWEEMYLAGTSTPYKPVFATTWTNLLV